MKDNSPTPGGETLGSRSKRIGLNVGLALLSLLTALFLAEFAVRIVAPQQLILKRPDVWQPADTLGWTHRPGVSTTINTGEGPVSLFTDSLGYRVGSKGRRTADTRILLLGDSYAEAFQVEYEESFAGILEATLTEKSGRPVAVRNTGVGGWNPPQYLAQARRSLREESFDLVLVSLYLANDVIPERVGPIPPRTPEEVHRLRLPHSLSAGEIVDAFLYPINDFLEVRSHLFILFKRQADRLLMRLGLSASYFPDVFRKSEARSDRWSVTADICAEIEELARRREIPTFFVLIPEASQVHTEAFERHVEGFGIDPDSVDLEQPNELLTRAMEKRGLTVIDLLPSLRRAAASGLRLYGTVDRHFNDRGHEVAAGVLAPVLADRLGEGEPAPASDSGG